MKSYKPTCIKHHSVEVVMLMTYLSWLVKILFVVDFPQCGQHYGFVSYFDILSSQGYNGGVIICSGFWRAK